MVPLQDSERTSQSRTKLSKKVAKILENMIVKGEIKSGSLLPTEADLGNQFSVSRTVVREAVTILEARGLVHIRHGIGTQVTAGGKRAFTSALLLALRRSGCTIRDLVDFRKLVEPEFAATAARRATGRDLAELQEALDEYIRATESGDTTAADEHHRRFHQAILRATHNPVVEALIDPLTEMILLSTVPAGSGLLPSPKAKTQLDVEAHRDIFSAIKSADSLGASRAVLTDFANARTDYDTSTPLAARPTTEENEDDVSPAVRPALTEG